ncbi:FAD-binding oxidoreductase [Candidatus Kaiserbacteria bacterium CG10_big_fil_rev_8_21_14_0_10_45_20]|uniref:FAD-binding oxidoreductase n=1 Tax=Candidatus Kaiserbacteria bacterium CG10_big_fil_rev_8_21_14_0_10_45_20 TaxID=1974607 RepID=A0A2H0UG63_9BACT|nr:MAG: FAD-binding oxidoreductase [Candidatus Kaiserbacteria bacterium CG10_big_fil_rev_8_21_14_0_10_45_20]
METFKQLLAKSFTGDTKEDSATKEAYSRDTSLFKVAPSLVVFPKSKEDVQALVNATIQARKQGEDISLTARSAGTCMTGGPLSESVVVDFTAHMNRLGEVSGNTVETEPGVYFRDFDAKTQKQNLEFPSYPASREIAALGGMVMNNAGGEKSLTYGKTADFVESLSMVLADGNEYEFTKLSEAELEEKKKLQTLEGSIYRDMDALIKEHYDLLQKAKPNVTKNSSGYALWDVYDPIHKTFDLTRVLTGSQGTLGIMTKARMRLITPQRHTRMLVTFLDDMNVLGNLAHELVLQKPECIESYDDKTLAVAVKYLGDIIKQMKGNIITLGWSFLPEFFSVITGGMPKLVIITEFAGDSDAEALKKAEEAQEAIAHLSLRTRVTASPREGEKYWAVRRESYNLLRKHTKKLRTAPFIEDIVVRSEKLPEFLPKLYAILDEYKEHMIYTIAGHVGNGNFHIIPLMDLSKPDSVALLDEIAEKVFTLVFLYEGSMSGEHNDGLVRTRYLPKMFGTDVYALFEKTKNIFDPENIFNPGKKVGFSETFVHEHIDIRMG